ncbi:MAG TPA: hypothetical protein VHJ54_03565 [Solirubrobacterales bacterium]|nr:hypothetical protein [Solirubrobacterales bacterium]
MPPVRRPYPRFIADSPQESQPYGRWEERLVERFAAACKSLASEAPSPLDPETLKWFPERAWGGRVYVPVTGRARDATQDEDGTEALAEYFGWVAFDRGDEGEPQSLSASADFTDVTAEDNPEWRIDLNDDVIGRWRGESGRAGAVTLVWGRPLVRGAVAATAELDMETVDQEVVSNERFTLVALDALEGYGDDIFLQVKLWSRRGQELAGENLYA